jgi:hypothetical protein
VEEVVDELRTEFASEGVHVTFVETPLTAEHVADSNLLLFNGEPLERVLADVQAATNYCGSCSELTEQETYCRTVEHHGQVYEEIPEALIRQAALATVRKEQHG